MSRTQSAARNGGDDWRLAVVKAVVGLEGEEALAMQIILRAARHSLTGGVGGTKPLNVLLLVIVMMLLVDIFVFSGQLIAV